MLRGRKEKHWEADLRFPPLSPVDPQNPHAPPPVVSLLAPAHGQAVYVQPVLTPHVGCHDGRDERHGSARTADRAGARPTANRWRSPAYTTSRKIDRLKVCHMTCRLTRCHNLKAIFILACLGTVLATETATYPDILQHRKPQQVSQELQVCVACLHQY